jgi:hypothetical protein
MRRKSCVRFQGAVFWVDLIFVNNKKNSKKKKKKKKKNLVICRAEDGVAKNILQSLAKSARRSGTAKVVTSETIRQRNEARAEARALAAATAAAASSSAEAAAVEPEDEEPEVDLDPDRVVEALFNNGRPLTIRERAEKVGCWVVFFFFLLLLLL